MRYLLGLLCVCALGVVPLVGCSETSPNMCEGIDCDDDNECTDDVCDFATGTCSNPPVNDGPPCRGGAGTCLAGVCVDLPMDVCTNAEDLANACPPGGSMFDVRSFELRPGPSRLYESSGRLSLCCAHPLRPRAPHAKPAGCSPRFLRRNMLVAASVG